MTVVHGDSWYFWFTNWLYVGLFDFIDSAIITTNTTTCMCTTHWHRSKSDLTVKLKRKSKLIVTSVTIQMWS